MSDLFFLQTLLASAFGLVIGSYLNVVIHRLPRGHSTVADRSGCPHCGSLIAWWDNVPVLSFLWLGGRCRQCRSRISWRYPLVELLTAGVFAGSFATFGPSWRWAAAAAFGCCLIVLSFIDFEHLLLPDCITIPGTVLGLAGYQLFPWHGRFLEHLAGVLLGSGILLALYGLWYLMRRVEGLGLGDVKLMAMVGAVVGWPAVLLAFFAGAASASLAALALLAFGRLQLKAKMAFGPFLCLGAAAAPFLAESSWFLGMLPALPW